ncbi:bifunctional diaminohydroxyphosphoribosylaminopyrimidine deaminase/5-amino-6-(5-phosphoribosylamino)uracil reductase RibD [Lactiplantibacillus pentosus]
MLTDWMQLAVTQAKKAGVATYQNPQVGAVLVKDGQVLAQGYHHYFGGDHAEVDVLRQVTSEQAKDATLVVTLEPCSHYGKTPPCCERIVQAGIRKVVIGQLDPIQLSVARAASICWIMTWRSSRVVWQRKYER